jgi:hypothetical protein
VCRRGGLGGGEGSGRCRRRLTMESVPAPMMSISGHSRTCSRAARRSWARPRRPSCARRAERRGHKHDRCLRAHGHPSTKAPVDRHAHRDARATCERSGSESSPTGSLCESAHGQVRRPIKKNTINSLETDYYEGSFKSYSCIYSTRIMKHNSRPAEKCRAENSKEARRP